jgi:hypothetical protein
LQDFAVRGEGGRDEGDFGGGIVIMPRDKSIVGDLINFRGLVYSPINENGVVFLFGRVIDDLHMYIEEIKPGFPDCVARRFTGKGWERVAIEFEFNSSSFKNHGHNPDDCDIIVCWEHDWKDCPLEVIELKTEMQGMSNWPIKHPSTTTEPGPKGEEALASLFAARKVQPQAQEWYCQIEKALHEWNEEIWTNVGRRYIGVYSPEKAFASFAPTKTALQIECFSRGEPLADTKVANAKFSPRWARFTVKQADQVEHAIEILKESHARLKAAMKAGEPTSYFSGGVRPGSEEALELEEVDHS